MKIPQCYNLPIKIHKPVCQINRLSSLQIWSTSKNIIQTNYAMWKIKDTPQSKFQEKISMLKAVEIEEF
jgi:hypothetical protein